MHVPWLCDYHINKKKGRSPQSIMFMLLWSPRSDLLSFNWSHGGFNSSQTKSESTGIIPTMDLEDIRACRSSARPAFTAGVVPFRGTTATERKDQIIKASAMMLQPTARFLAKRLCWYAFSPQGRKWFHRRKKMLEIHGNPGVLLIDVVSCWLMLLDVDCWWEIGHPAKWQKQKARMKGHTHTKRDIQCTSAINQATLHHSNKQVQPPSLPHTIACKSWSDEFGDGIQGRQTAVR